MQHGILLQILSCFKAVLRVCVYKSYHLACSHRSNCLWISLLLSYPNPQQLYCMPLLLFVIRSRNTPMIPIIVNISLCVKGWTLPLPVQTPHSLHLLLAPTHFQAPPSLLHVTSQVFALISSRTLDRRRSRHYSLSFKFGQWLYCSLGL